MLEICFWVNIEFIHPERLCTVCVSMLVHKVRRVCSSHSVTQLLMDLGLTLGVFLSVCVCALAFIACIRVCNAALTLQHCPRKFCLSLSNLSLVTSE